MPRAARCRAAALRGTGTPRPSSRHVVEPGAHLRPDVDLARAGRAALSAGLFHIAAEAAADLRPLDRAALEAVLDALVDLEVVGQHPRRGAVDHVGEGDG